MIFAPPVSIRVLSVGYMYALSMLYDQVKDHWMFVRVDLCMEAWLLHLFCVAVLFTWGAGLWSARIVFDDCLCHIETLVQYFLILSVLIDYLETNINRLFATTHAIFYIAWNVWQNLKTSRKRKWVQYPQITALFLMTYIFIVLPIIWMQKQRATSRESFSVMWMSSTLLCDISFTLLQLVSFASLKLYQHL